MQTTPIIEAVAGLEDIWLLQETINLTRYCDIIYICWVQFSNCQYPIKVYQLGSQQELDSSSPRADQYPEVKHIEHSMLVGGFKIEINLTLKDLYFSKPLYIKSAFTNANVYHEQKQCAGNWERDHCPISSSKIAITRIVD